MLTLKSLSEQQMYVLLRAFEQDCRAIVDYFIEGRIESANLFSGLEEKISHRRKNERNDLTSDIELLDLSDLIEIIFKNKKLLPMDILSDFNSLKSTTTNLIRIRNRVMHARPLYEDDDKTFILIIQDLQSTSWKNLVSTSVDLNKGHETALENYEIIEESTILHNLPRAEHGETGLVGRSEDIKRVTNWLMDERTNVVTIAGSGGLGKTALALQVAYDLLDNIDNPFDAILWVSLKQEKLTTDGIQSISNAISDIPSAIIELGSAIDSNFRGAISNLREALAGSKVLICLDNLETISGSEFMELYDALPEVKFLLTSRQGIGQIERRYDLNALSEKDSLHYLHLLIRKYGVGTLELVSDAAKRQIVLNYVHNPLSIKWFVLSIKSGKTIYDIKNSNKDLLTFCVESVVLGLSVNARSALLAIFVAKRAVYFEELVALTLLGMNELSAGVQELNRSALIRTRVLSSDFLRQEVELTEITNEYLRVSGQYLKIEIEAFEVLNQKQLQDEENRQKDLNVSIYQSYSISVEKDDQKPVASLLRQALRSQKLNPKKALELVQAAKTVAPEYWEVYKVEAYVRHFLGEDRLVEEIYGKAFELTSNNDEKSVVKYFLTQHFLRIHAMDKALDSATACLGFKNSTEALHHLGFVEIRSNMFESGIEHISKAVENSNSDSRLIYITSLISGYRRWSEHILEVERNYDLALSKLRPSRDLLTKEIDAGVRDQKFYEENAKILYQANEILKVIHRFNGDISHQELDHFKDYYRQAKDAIKNPKMGKKIMDQIRFLSRLSVQLKDFIESFNLDELISLDHSTLAGQSFLVGKVHSTVDGRYGFIEHKDFPRNVFFSGAALLPGIRVASLIKGQSVSFELEETLSEDDSKVKARSVWPSDSDF